MIHHEDHAADGIMRPDRTSPRKPPQEAGGLRRKDAARVTGATERMMLSIVVPVWGTRHDLPHLLPALQRALDGVEPRSEILVCATDPSLHHVVESASAIFVESKSSGYGDILRTGIDAAQGELVMTMDADFAYAADFVPVIWAHRDEAEVVIGSRYVRGAVAEMGFSRRTASRLLNWVYRFGLSVPFRDLSSGFRLYRRRVLLDIQPLEAHGLDVLPEIMVKAQCQGWRVIEVPFWYRGAEPWNRMRMVQFGLAYLETLGRLLSLRNSVRAADYDNRAFDSWIPLQRSWQRRRFEVVHSFMGPQASRATLDIGCGSSRIVQTLPGVVGMDLGMHKLRWLRAPGRHLVQGSLTRLPFVDGAFDTVICSEVIEHIPRDQVHLEELVRVIAPGGSLILGTPDYSRRRWLFLEWLYGKVFPNGYVKEHINRYTRRGLQRDLEALGLSIENVRYVGGSEMIFAARVAGPTSSAAAAR
jgi:SAM-dependent methyltransferase